MTESEARTKWCPMVRYSFVGDTGQEHLERMNRGITNKHVHCIASSCMMWRWRDGLEEYASRHSGVKSRQVDDYNGAWEERKISRFQWFSRPLGDRRRGYCGLAGECHR